MNKFFEGDWSKRYHGWNTHYTFEQFKYLIENKIDFVLSQILASCDDYDEVYDCLYDDFYNDRDDDAAIETLKYYANTLIKSASKSISNNKIKIYRTISLKNIEDFDKDDLGVCWTWDRYNLKTLENILLDNCQFSPPYYVMRLAGYTNVDNIDWMESLFLYIKYCEDEKEVRVVDVNNLKLTSYVIMDDDMEVIKQRGDENLS